MTLTETDYRPDAPDRPGAALVAAPEALIVERNRTISAVVALLAGLVTAAYLTRAVGGGSLLDWSLAGALGLVAVGYAWSFVDARTPLLVADDYGIRVRIGRSWRGLPWLAIDHVEHTPRSSLLGDGRLALVTRDTDGLVAGLGPMGRLQAQLTERMYGTPFALPLGLSTRVIGYDGDIDLALTALALGRTDIVHPAAEEQIEDLDLTGDLSLDDTDEFAPVEQVEQVEPVDLADPNDLPVSEEPGADHPDAPAAESGWVAGWSRLVARTRGYVDRSAEPGGDETGASVVPSESPGPLRPPHRPAGRGDGRDVRGTRTPGGARRRHRPGRTP